MSRHIMHRRHTIGPVRDQAYKAVEMLDHFHFRHTENGMTAFVCHEADVLVISDPFMRAKLREVLSDGGVLDFPEVQAKHGDEVVEAYVPKISEVRR